MAERIHKNTTGIDTCNLCTSVFRLAWQNDTKTSNYNARVRDFVPATCRERFRFSSFCSKDDELHWRVTHEVPFRKDVLRQSVDTRRMDHNAYSISVFNLSVDVPEQNISIIE